MSQAAQAVTAKRQVVSFIKNNVSHVRYVEPGEDPQEVLARPTDYDIKMRRIAEEQKQIETFPDYERVSAYIALLKPDLKAEGLRYPMEKYRFAKARMEAEAAPIAHAAEKIVQLRDTSPKPENLKPLHVCPNCNGSFKRLDVHQRNCPATPGV